MNKPVDRDPTPAASVTEQASDWWITLNAGEGTPADHQAFAAWAARSPERIEAFLETARLTQVLKSKTLRWPDTPVEELAREAQAAGAEVLPFQVPLTTVNPSSRTTRRPLLIFALAATLLILLGSLAWLRHPGTRYETAVGEQRSVALEDGSVVTLNTASRVQVSFGPDHRLIRLLAGEALFQVARDPARPFEVVAGDAKIRALGTSFNVNRGARRTVVTVVEGKVGVLSLAVSPDRPAPIGNPHPMTYLSAGEELTVEAQASTPPAHRADVAVATAWTQRRLVFDHRPIGEAAEEFNRYNRLKIEIESPALRAEQMTAVFQANDPQSFLDFLARLPGVSVQRAGATVEVSGSALPR